MKNNILFLLVLLASAVTAQSNRTKEQTDKLNAKNGFRKYILGTSFGHYNDRIANEVEGGKVHSKLYEFKDEDMNISPSIIAERIVFQFTTERLDEVSIKIRSGSKEFYDFLLREYGSPDNAPGDVKTKVQLYEWKGRLAHLLFYYAKGKEGAIFKITSPAVNDKDTEIRQGF